MTQLAFGIRSSQHHRSWAQIRANFVAADEWGLESAWVFDHMIPLSDPRSGPNLEGWTLLAGLAEATTRVRIGTMVTGITYRNPSLLLKEATTVDHISNGRVFLGVGAAWFEGEHQMFGFDFPPVGDRVSMLREALEIFTLLQEQGDGRSSFDGKYYTLRDAIFEPKPLQQKAGRPHIPVVIGCSGERLLRMTARYADQWDNNFGDDGEYLARKAILEAACEKIGRDPREIRRSTTLPTDFFGWDHDRQLTRIEQLRGMGITDVLVHAPEQVDVMRPFMEDRLPKLRAALGG